MLTKDYAGLDGIDEAETGLRIDCEWKWIVGTVRAIINFFLQAKVWIPYEDCHKF